MLGVGYSLTTYAGTWHNTLHPSSSTVLPFIVLLALLISLFTPSGLQYHDFGINSNHFHNPPVVLVIWLEHSASSTTRSDVC